MSQSRGPVKPRVVRAACPILFQEHHCRIGRPDVEAVDASAWAAAGGKTTVNLAKFDLSLEQLTRALQLPGGAQVYATQPAGTGNGAITIFIMGIDLPSGGADGIPTLRYEDGRLVLEGRNG